MPTVAWSYVPFKGALTVLAYWEDLAATVSTLKDTGEATRVTKIMVQ